MAIPTYNIRLPKTQCLGTYSIAGKSCSISGDVNGSRILWATIIYLDESSGLTGNIGLHTFVFDMLILGGMFMILVVRENGYFLGVYSQQNTHSSHMWQYDRNFCNFNLRDPKLDTDSYLL